MRSQLNVRVRGSDVTIRGHRSPGIDAGRNDDSWMPTIDELSVPSSRVQPKRPVIRLASIVAAMAVVVGAGLAGNDAIGPGSGSGPDPARSMHGPVDDPRRTGEPGPPSRRTPPRAEIVILLPGSGDVVLGGVVPVAGFVTVSGAPRGVSRPGVVRVTISADGAILGEATLPVVDGRYVGWIRVAAPARGVVAEVRVRDQGAGQTASSREFVLQTGSSAGGRGSSEGRASIGDLPRAGHRHSIPERQAPIAPQPACSDRAGSSARREWRG